MKLLIYLENSSCPLGCVFLMMRSEKSEEFVSFTELQALYAKVIAKLIDNFLRSQDLDPMKCVGFWFDVCSTMAGKESGVQAILQEKCVKAMFFHCSSHRLNLVVNDLNAIPEIRNTIGTIKDIMFFRDSVLGRKLIPNISCLCETRWSEKYKSIRVFKEQFIKLAQALEDLSVSGNSNTRKTAFQLNTAAGKFFYHGCCLNCEVFCYT